MAHEGFADAARRFRAVVDDPEPADARAFARLARNAVARVYLAASMLPEARGEAADAAQTDEWQRVRVRDVLRARLGDDVSAERLAEIYVYLGDALRLLEQPDPDVRRVRLAFEGRWGSHAVDAVEPLHALARGG